MSIVKKALIIILTFLFVLGCSADKTDEYAGKGELNCSREGSIEDGEVVLKYNLTYKNGNIIKLTSIEEVISDDQNILTEYENAYKNIFKVYDNLEHFENTITRTKTSVTSKTVIDYDKINIGKLLEIEGEENNIIENNKAKVEKWMELAKKFGTTCE